MMLEMDGSIFPIIGKINILMIVILNVAVANVSCEVR
jgi:hypothetical protein